MNKNKLITAMSVAISLLSTTALAEGINAQLMMNQSEYMSSDDVTVTVTLTNEEQIPVKILKWYTAAEGLKNLCLRSALTANHVNI